MIYVWLTLFILLVMTFWLLNLIGIPGNWMIAAISLLWIFVGPTEYRFSWIVIVVLIVLALVGETIEFGASVVGTKKAGWLRTRGCALCGWLNCGRNRRSNLWYPSPDSACRNVNWLAIVCRRRSLGWCNDR